MWADPDFAHDRYAELRGRTWHIWLRWGLLLLIAAVCVAALFNAYGQGPTTSAVAAPQALMQLEAPPRLSGGLRPGPVPAHGARPRALAPQARAQ